ncbi:MAG TPA: DUF4465 domain-containing protein [Bacteroidetes bacterium]|nr:DUF4465 domain-containing protein [Bacteroidota bacterium]
MKKTFTLIAALVFSTFLLAQTTVDFEDFSLPAEGFLNGSDGSGGFSSNGFFFPNDYNADWGSWSGWAISAATDTQTPGFMNQYSSISGGGVGGSAQYAVSFVAGSSGIKIGEPRVVDNVAINNGTYPYLSMLEGDAFAKKFGGEDGNDPDFFLLTIKGWLNGEQQGDSIGFYLADYRFADNSMDYIVSEWTTVDLSTFDAVDSLSFSLSSSDVGMFGMNTPAYFCMDNLNFTFILDANEQPAELDVSVFPNPATDYLRIVWNEQQEATASIFNLNGQLIQKMPLSTGQQNMDVQALATGMYILKIQTEEGWMSVRFVKK